MDESRDLCAGDEVKKARQRLKQVGRALIQYSHKLRSNSARKRVPADVREPLAGEADAIGGDTKALRAKVDCPAAADLLF